jgi:DNA invertase Pin-like site-specific DNA recombinase
MTKRRKTPVDQSIVVGYVRVSTDEQADSGLGMAAQRAAIEAEADRRGWTLVGIYEDAGLSGKSVKGRQGLADALEAIEAGEAGALVVAKLDRLSRSLADFAALTSQAQRDGWNLVALDLGIDLGTAAGEFMANVMASAAQWERRIIGQRTRDALAVKRAQGVKLGRPRSLPDSVRSRILTAHEAGRGWSEIASELNAALVPTARGGVRWYPSTVRAVVTSQPRVGVV